jgi:amicyanin
MKRISNSMRALGVAVAVVGSTVALAACGGGASTTSTPSVPTLVFPPGSETPGFPAGSVVPVMPGMPGMPGMTGTPGSAPAPAPAAANAVRIESFVFAPATLTVKVGTTVTWVNHDEEPHTVAAKDGSFHSPGMGTGGTYSFTFSTAGTFDYVCTIHPFMHGTVVVTP